LATCIPKMVSNLVICTQEKENSMETCT
jgi:hypothetical protein